MTLDKKKSLIAWPNNIYIYIHYILLDGFGNNITSGYKRVSFFILNIFT